MTNLENKRSSSYSDTFVVPRVWLDANDHMNNIEFVRLMQEVAVGHSDAVGCTKATIEMGAAWFVRSHSIEYKRPAAEGDTISVETWIDGTDRLRSTRKYVFRNEAGDTLALAETEWILVDRERGRPLRIPEDLINLFW